MYGHIRARVWVLPLSVYRWGQNHLLSSLCSSVRLGPFLGLLPVITHTQCGPYEWAVHKTGTSLKPSARLPRGTILQTVYLQDAPSRTTGQEP